MSRLKALREHWRRHPPFHKLAAAWMGYKPPDEAQPTMTADDFRRVMQVTGGKIDGVRPR